jgi:hypothetical protein
MVFRKMCMKQYALFLTDMVDRYIIMGVEDDGTPIGMY